MERSIIIVLLVICTVFVLTDLGSAVKPPHSVSINNMRITDRKMYRQPWPGKGRNKKSGIMEQIIEETPLSISTLTLNPAMKLIGFQWPDGHRLILKWDEDGWNILKGQADEFQFVKSVAVRDPELVFYGNGLILSKDMDKLADIYLGTSCNNVRLIVSEKADHMPEFRTFDIFGLALQWNILDEAEKNLEFSRTLLEENQQYFDASWSTSKKITSYRRDQFTKMLDLLDSSIKQKRNELTDQTNGWLPIVMSNYAVKDRFNTFINLIPATWIDHRYFGDYFGKHWASLNGMPEYQLSITFRAKTRALIERAWRHENVAFKKGNAIKENNKTLFAAGFTNSLSTVPKNKPFVGEYLKSYSLELAKGEYESFQLVLVPMGQMVKNVSLEIKDNGQIPKKNIKLYEVMYVRLKEAVGIAFPPKTSGEGYSPDILQPISEDQPFFISPNSNTTIWITVESPEKIKPGKHQFHILVKKDGQVLAELPVSIHIFDFAMGRNRLQSVAGMRYNNLSSFYRIEDAATIKAYRRRFQKELLEHGMNPLHLYGLSPKADELQFCIDNGMTAAMLPMYENLSKPRGIEEFTKLYASLDGETFKEIDAEIQLQPQEGDPDIEDWDIIITPEASLSQYKAVKIHYADADRRNCVSLNTTGKFIAIEGTKGHSIEADNLLIQINDRTPSKQQNAQLINPVKDFRFDGGLHSILFTKPFDADIKSIRLINSRRVDWIAKTKKSRDEFRAVGGDDLTLLTYGYDERGADANPELFESLRLSKKVFPDVKTLTCAREVTEMPEIFQYLDYYSPNNAYINIPQVKDISQRTGTQIWMYVGGGGRYPFPNFERVDLPRICSRAFFWGHIRYNLKGWMYFAINFWRKNTWVPRQWPEIWEHWEPGWGMGALIYPGPNGTPVPSARLEAMRDGIEDYNYFAIAEELLKTRQFTDIKQKQGIKEFIEAAKKTLSPGVSGFLQDHSKMSQIRSKLGRYIEMMSKLDSLP